MAGVIKLESDPRITVLALSWRDIKAPKAGGCILWVIVAED